MSAEQLGFSPRTMRDFVAEPRNDDLNRGEQRRRKIRKLQGQSLSMRAIAEQAGCSVSTVHNALNHQDHDQGPDSDHVEASWVHHRPNHRTVRRLAVYRAQRPE